MKRNQTESNGMILRNHSESYPGMTQKTTENDRKRPETTAGSPFGSATSRNGFLGNSPIFPEILRFSLIFSDILRLFS